MLYREIEQIIFQSIDERFATSARIQKFVEQKILAEIDSRDFQRILDRLVQNNDLVHLSNVAFSAYFYPDRIPVSFFLQHSGRVNAYYDGKNSGFPLEVITPESVVEIDPDKEIEIFPYFTERELKEIEDGIARGLTYAKVAELLNLDEKKFIRRAKFDAPTKSAIGRGRRREQLIKDCRTVYDFACQDANPNEIILQTDEVEVTAVAQDVSGETSETKTTESESPSAEPEIRVQRVLSRKRLCRCGKPLGARTKECRECFIIRKNKKDTLVKEPAVESFNFDSEVRKVFKSINFDNKKLCEIIFETFMKFSSDAAKESFLKRIWSEIVVKVEKPAQKEIKPIDEMD
jgi:hypothetical protein